MNLLNFILLADVPLYQHMGDRLHRGRGRINLVDLWPVLLVFVLVAIVIAIVVAVRKRNDMTKHCNDPNKLFRELSQAHGLDRGSQNLLWKLAEALQLAQPAEVFLQPAYFHADRIPPELRGAEAELDTLHRRLF